LCVLVYEKNRKNMEITSTTFLHLRELAYKVLCNKVKTPEDLEDLVQTTILNVLENKESIDPDKADSYLATAAYNTLKNYYREKSALAEVDPISCSYIGYCRDTADCTSVQEVTRWVEQHYTTGCNIGCGDVAESLVGTIEHFQSSHGMVDILLGWSECYCWITPRYDGSGQTQMMLRRIFSSMPKEWQQRVLGDGKWRKGQRQQLTDLFAQPLPNTCRWRKEIEKNLMKLYHPKEDSINSRLNK
jgi:hypothetical protein